MLPEAVVEGFEQHCSNNIACADLLIEYNIDPFERHNEDALRELCGQTLSSKSMRSALNSKRSTAQKISAQQQRAHRLSRIKHAYATRRRALDADDDETSVKTIVITPRRALSAR